MERTVKARTAYRTDIDIFESNNAENKAYRYQLVEYYRDGRLYCEVIFNRNGKEETVTDYFYYEDKRLKEKEIYYPADKTSEITAYRYNQAGDVTEEALYYDKELYLKQVNDYDEKGRQTRSTQQDADGNEMGYEVFEYEHENGEITRHLHYDELGELSWEIQFEYNADKKVQKETNIKHDEDITEYTLFTYNEHGKSIRSETYDIENNLIGFVTVEYDEAQRPVKYASETYGFNTSKMINQVTYNEAGKVLVNEFYDVLNGYLVSRESFEYDEDGALKFEEQFEFGGRQSDKKTHYRLQYAYEYFADDEVEKETEAAANN